MENIQERKKKFCVKSLCLFVYMYVCVCGVCWCFWCVSYFFYIRAMSRQCLCFFFGPSVRLYRRHRNAYRGSGKLGEVGGAVVQSRCCVFAFILVNFENLTVQENTHHLPFFLLRPICIYTAYPCVVLNIQKVIADNHMLIYKLCAFILALLLK